jgi:hypothetical protein
MMVRAAPVLQADSGYVDSVPVLVAFVYSAQVEPGLDFAPDSEPLLTCRASLLTIWTQRVYVIYS